LFTRQHSPQTQIQPVSLGGRLGLIFGSQVSLRVQYCKSDEVYITTQL